MKQDEIWLLRAEQLDKWIQGGGVESETAETLFCKFSKSEEETI